MENKPNKLTRAHKIALSIISLACCCVIGVSAFALVAPDAVEQLTTQQSETVAQENSYQDQNEAADGQEPAEGGTDENGASQNSNPQNGNGQGNGESGSSANGSNNTKGSNGSSNGNSNGSSASSPSSNSSNSKSSNNSSSKNTSGSSSQGSQGAAASSSDTVTVSVSVSSNAADGRVSGSAHPTFKKGATAYDALCATGLSISTKSSQYGIYVSAIGGLAEFEYGGKSGWMYSVNGNTPNVSCSSYKLKDGDSVSWYYVK